MSIAQAPYGRTADERLEIERPAAFADLWERCDPSAALDDADRAHRLRAAAVWLARPAEDWRMGHYQERLSAALGHYAVDHGLCGECLLQHGAETPVRSAVQEFQGREQVMSTCPGCGGVAL